MKHRELLPFSLHNLNFCILDHYNKIYKSMTEQGFKRINLDILRGLLAPMMHNNLARKAYKLFNKKYGLSFGELSPTEVYERAAKIESRTNHHSEEGETESEWASGEQKIFCAVLPHLFFIHNINIESITQTDLNLLKQIFTSKSSQIIHFEILHIESSIKPRTFWDEQDLLLLSSIMENSNHLKESESSMNWKHVALQLFLSGGHFHSTRDCREKWMNHLNPEVLKGSWSCSEDLELFMTIKKYGCKWSQISKQMKGIRTEHMIKNRAKAIIKKILIKPTKVLNSTKIDKIIDTLQQSLKLETQKLSKQTQIIFQQVQIQIKQESQSTFREQENPFSTQVLTLKQEKQIMFANLFDVLELPTERVIVTEKEIDENWQYDEEQWVQQSEIFSPSNTLYMSHPHQFHYY